MTSVINTTEYSVRESDRVFKSLFECLGRVPRRKGAIMSSIIEKLAVRGIEVEAVETIKNGTTLNGFRILKENKDISPVIYWNHEYEDEDLFVEKVVKVAEQESPKFDVAKLRDREYVLKNTIFCMQKKSDELVVKKEFLDLEGVLRIVISDGQGVVGSCKITKALQESIGLTDEELFDHAIENMHDRFRIRSITEVIGLPAEFSGVEDACPMYVCTSEGQATGSGSAAMMMPDEVFKEFCQMKHVDSCTILPSSTEELVLLAGENEDATALAALVHAINEEQVDPVIQLNPTVYVYNVHTGKVSIAATF